ncbi:MAG: MAPEG family protein [Cyanobacteria bacterium J06626_23]
MALLTLPNLLLYSIPLAALLIYVPYSVVAIARVSLARSLADPMTVFAKPRTFNEKLPDYAQRANWAHQNAFESFALFAPAALMAYITDQSGPLVLGAVIAYLIARLLFAVFYILNVPPLRSLMFGVGSLSIGTLYLLSCRSIWPT